MSHELDYQNPLIKILTSPDIEPDWLIPDVMAQGNFIILGGEPGAGKSSVSYLIGLCVAAGIPVFEGTTEAVRTPKVVLYFDDENSPQERDQYLRWAFFGRGEKHFDYDTLPDFFIPVHFQLGEKNWADVAATYVEAFKPDLIIFDTANACFGIVDENSNGEAAEEIRKIRRIQKLCLSNNNRFPTVLLLKHNKVRSEKGGTRMLRGAKDWQGKCDQVLFQVKAAGRPRASGLSLTRLIPDKTRAFGLRHPVYITPSWTDTKRSGLFLKGDWEPNREHKDANKREEKDEE